MWLLVNDVRRSVTAPLALDVVSTCEVTLGGVSPGVLHVVCAGDDECGGSWGKTVVMMSPKLKRSSGSCSGLKSFHVL
jgi:hypothetical protein